MSLNKQIRTIPFFNYSYIFESHKKQFLSCFDNVCSRGAFIMQKDLSDFEANLAEYNGANYAVGVANATDGLEMLLSAGGVGTGDEVILCSHTMIATASAVHMNGAVSVPVEAGSGLKVVMQARLVWVAA